MDNNISIGNAGEFFVAAELERRGLTASVLMRNTKDFDILAINRETNNQYAIQVKTTTKRDWILSKKSEEKVEDNVIHQEWLLKPGKDGQLHNDNSIRIFSDNDNTYLNKWDYLK